MEYRKPDILMLSVVLFTSRVKQISAHGNQIKEVRCGKHPDHEAQERPEQRVPRQRDAIVRSHIPWSTKALSVDKDRMAHPREQDKYSFHNTGRRQLSYI